MEKALESISPVASAVANAVRAQHADRLTMADVILVVSTTMRAAAVLHGLTGSERKIVVTSSVNQALTDAAGDIVPDVQGLVAEIDDVIEILYSIHKKTYKHSRRVFSCLS